MMIIMLTVHVRNESEVMFVLVVYIQYYVATALYLAAQQGSTQINTENSMYYNYSLEIV